MLVNKDSHEYKTIRHVLDTLGLMIIGVSAEAKKPAFYYTIGLHEKLGLPELLLIGNFEEQVSTEILQRMSDAMTKHGTMFVDGAHVDNGGKYPLVVYNTSAIAQKRYTFQATNFYGHEDYMVQQILIPDPNGRYPTDKVCHRSYRVPVLRSTMAIMQGTKARH